MNFETSSQFELSSADEPSECDIIERSSSIAISVGSDRGRHGLELDFNDLLEQVGSYGPFQKFLIVLLVMPSAAFCGLIYVAQYFILMVPEHFCTLPASSNFSELDVEHFKSIWIPFEFENDQRTKKFASCLLYDEPNINQLSSSDYRNKLTSTQCSNWTFDYAKSDLYPTMATEHNWICGAARWPYHQQTIFYIGTSVGCVFFGYISDR